MKITPAIAVSLLLATTLMGGCESLHAPQPEGPVAVDLAHAPARDWLLARAELCRQGMPEQRARMMELAVAGGGHEERMERVVLASCHPDHTPGLLREALRDFDDSDASDRDRALLGLLRDHARSYRLLEERNAALAAQLEATINGIREIEADLDALRPERGAP